MSILSLKELHYMRNQKGFTLIELMIVVAILGILFALAMSAYQQHVNGGNGMTPNMGTQGGTLAVVKPQTLVCTDAASGTETHDPAIPGQTWTFEGGVYVTADANGNAITKSVTGKDCRVE